MYLVSYAARSMAIRERHHSVTCVVVAFDKE